MELLVQKYGGSSLGTVARIQSVAQQIAHEVVEAGKDHRRVVVVSAMGDTTDELIRLATEVCSTKESQSQSAKASVQREMDMLLSVGERVSMSLLSMALSCRGVRAISLTGSQTGIITTCEHRRARIRKIRPHRLLEFLEHYPVVIVAGFQGVSEKREITTLGRGGSDTTAVALAASLQAQRCEIRTDVPALFSGDPAKIGNAFEWNELPYRLAVEMAHAGATVLHPRAAVLANDHQVSLQVLHAEERDRSKGTNMMNDVHLDSDDLEKWAVTGVLVDSKKELLDVRVTRKSVLGGLFETAGKKQLEFFSPFFIDNRSLFYVCSDQKPQWEELLEYLSSEGFVESSRWTGCVPLSLVGECLSLRPQIMVKATELLNELNLPFYVGSASSSTLVLGVGRERADEALTQLHKAFFP